MRLERGVEAAEALLAEAARVLPRQVGRQENDGPAVEASFAADLEAAAAQHLVDQLRVVVVAGDDVHREAQRLERRFEPLVALHAFVLDDVARDEHRIRRPAPRSPRMLEHRDERLMRIHAAQTPVRRREQMRIGQLKQDDRPRHPGLTVVGRRSERQCVARRRSRGSAGRPRAAAMRTAARRRVIVSAGAERMVMILDSSAGPPAIPSQSGQPGVSCGSPTRCATIFRSACPPPTSITAKGSQLEMSFSGDNVTQHRSSTSSERPPRRLLANAVRVLAMDAVERAKSGHPGMPMGMADIAEVLWNDYLKFNPANPEWFDRDRFVLSNGHGSMLLYAVAHLTGYPLGIDEIERFRQLGSRTAGHPERE